MSNLNSTSVALQSIFWSKDQPFFKQSLLILAGVFLLAFASQLSIPLQPVPLTFQSATVVLIGMTYGARRGALVILTYLTAGAIGLPVFADFSFGFKYFLGPTAGYLLGFLPAAFISGWLAEKGLAKTFVTSFIAACLGASIIFILGVSYLSTFVGWHNAFILGLLPFIVSELVKLSALALLVPKLWKQF